MQNVIPAGQVIMSPLDTVMQYCSVRVNACLRNGSHNSFPGDFDHFDDDVDDDKVRICSLPWHLTAFTFILQSDGGFISILGGKMGTIQGMPATLCVC